MAKLIAHFCALLYLITFIASIFASITIKYNPSEDVISKKLKLDTLTALTGTVMLLSGLIMAFAVLIAK